MMNGVAIPMAGIGEVCTSLYHRRQGLAQRVITFALDVARKKGFLISSLHTSRKELQRYYSALGFISVRTRYKIYSLDQTKNYSHSPDLNVTISTASTQQAPIIMEYLCKRNQTDFQEQTEATKEENSATSNILSQQTLNDHILKIIGGHVQEQHAQLLLSFNGPVVRSRRYWDHWLMSELKAKCCAVINLSNGYAFIEIRNIQRQYHRLY